MLLRFWVGNLLGFKNIRKQASVMFTALGQRLTANTFFFYFFFKQMEKPNCCQARVEKRKCLKVGEYNVVTFLKSLISKAQQPPNRKLLRSVKLKKKPQTNNNRKKPHREASKKSADDSFWLQLVLTWKYLLTKAVINWLHFFSFIASLGCTEEAFTIAPLKGSPSNSVESNSKRLTFQSCDLSIAMGEPWQKGCESCDGWASQELTVQTGSGRGS